MRALARFSIVVAMLVMASAASAQQFPSRTIRLVVPYAAGGTGDIVARVLADRLAISLGQSVVVENRPGASGAIGSKAVASAPPDGHTLLVGQTGEMAINQHWNKALGYDPAIDLTPVALATIVPLALVVPGKAAYSSVAEMIAASKSRGLAFASAGTATPGHFAGEVLKLRTKSNMNHVPYNGAGPALNDILGGHVGLFFSGFPAAVPHVKAGSIKLLAVSSAKRSSAAPDVPTVAQASGIKDFDITLWQGFFAPHGTPQEVVAKLNAEINKTLQLPEVKSKLREAGADVATISIDEFAEFTKSESTKFLKIIKDANLKPGG
ncbi:MAG: tripartite tricarboxylate transporter substrate binding protein [Rhizobiales bacterium]|nr:tripartite tricarboxylate transporter substrate binding protein [Hyphomicrobiales bacterium]